MREYKCQRDVCISFLVRRGIKRPEMYHLILILELLI
jgi:hypothetical protein